MFYNFPEKDNVFLSVLSVLRDEWGDREVGVDQMFKLAELIKEVEKYYKEQQLVGPSHNID